MQYFGMCLLEGRSSHTGIDRFRRLMTTVISVIRIVCRKGSGHRSKEGPMVVFDGELIWGRLHRLLKVAIPLTLNYDIERCSAAVDYLAMMRCMAQGFVIGVCIH